MASRKKRRPNPPPRPPAKPPRPTGRRTGPATREQALAAARVRKREQLRRRLGGAALGLAALAVVVAYVLTSRGERRRPTAQSERRPVTR